MSMYRWSGILAAIILVALTAGCPKSGPTAGFTAATTLAVAPATVQFTDTSQVGGSAIVQWEWEFGDGGTSANQHPSHQYTEPGVYTVSLRVVNAQGENVLVRQDFVTIVDSADLPVAAFTASPQLGSAPLAVQFTDTSTSPTFPVTGWLWDFGDGATSTLQHPAHTYTEDGVYTVSLQVTAASWTDTAEQADAIVVADLVAPTANFGVSIQQGYAPLSVQFTDVSTEGSAPITGWAWSFGDGATSTAQHPAHTYAAAGSFTVSLTVTTAHGAHTDTRTGYIGVLQPQAPTANFSTQQVAQNALTVAFTDLSSAGTSSAMSWLWDFGDGATSTDASPTHTYAADGTYTVSLTVSTGHGSDTATQNIVVQIT